MQGSEGQVIDSRWSLAAMDSIPVTVILPKDSEVLSSEADEWQGLFPISTLIRGVSLPAKGPDPTFLSGSQPPVRLEQVSSTPLYAWHANRPSRCTSHG